MEANTQKENVEYLETNPQTAADADIFRRKFPKHLLHLHNLSIALPKRIHELTRSFYSRTRLRQVHPRRILALTMPAPARPGHDLRHLRLCRMRYHLLWLRHRRHEPG